MEGYFKKNCKKIKNLSRQGPRPNQLAISIIMAVLVSLFPIFGITTIVLIATALLMRLNLSILLVSSSVIEPLKILLPIPFITIGINIFGTQHKRLTFSAFKESFSINVLVTLKNLSYELLCGTAGWTIIVLLVSLCLYFLLKVPIETIFR